ncbi:MAG: Clp protease ClpP [Romboutsia sp.]
MKKDNLKDLLQVKNQTSTTADLYFYGDIVSSWWGAWDDTDQYPESIKNFLDEHKNKDLNIYINSGGGSVFAGLAIYNMLKRHEGQKTVYIDGLAASISSVIALAGDKVVIPNTASFMIHKPWGWTSGNANDFRKMANDLDSIEKCILNVYEENLKDEVSIDIIKQMVDEETWLTGDEACNYFNVELGEEKNIVACSSEYFNSYKHVPTKFKNKEPKENIKNKNEIDKLRLELQLI